jgi:hypothetical protein
MNFVPVIVAIVILAVVGRCGDAVAAPMDVMNRWELGTLTGFR